MNILLQTTIPHIEDDWNVGRFSLLAEALRGAGHDVTARNRENDTDGNDVVLSRLCDTGFDQLWLMAVDTGDGLSDRDVANILDFRERGGGLLTARDHQDLGASLEKLHSLGIFNHFHSMNAETEAERLATDDQDNPDISYPNYHSGANGDYQPIVALAPAHELLHTARNEDGTIAFFPAHPHEGAVGTPPDTPFARVLAQGRSIVTGRLFNLAVVIEGQPCETRSGTMGRAIAESTFHHFADLNWDTTRGAPSFVTDRPGHEIADDPARLEIFKDYVRNAARWLGARTAEA
jgi:hypothetical protein